MAAILREHRLPVTQNLLSPLPLVLRRDGMLLCQMWQGVGERVSGPLDNRRSMSYQGANVCRRHLRSPQEGAHCEERLWCFLLVGGGGAGLDGGSVPGSLPYPGCGHHYRYPQVYSEELWTRVADGGEDHRLLGSRCSEEGAAEVRLVAVGPGSVPSEVRQ